MKDVLMDLELCLVGEMDEATPPKDFDISSKFDKKNFDVDESDDKVIYAYTVSGVSKNKRNWTPEVVRSIGKQVLDKMPVGHLGHIKKEDVGTLLPEPQVVWFGSKEEELEDKSVRMWLKGYMLPTAEKAKIWIKNKAIDSISVWGIVSQEKVDGVDVIKSIDLKSIDLSRKLGEGLPAYITGLASEMDGSFEDLREALHNEIRTHYESMRLPNDKDYVYVYIENMYPDNVVISYEKSQIRTLFRLPYSVNKNGDIKVDYDKAVEVERSVQFVEKKSKKPLFANEAVAVASEMDGSFEEIRNSIDAQARNHFTNPLKPKEYVPLDIRKLYPSFAIICYRKKVNEYSRERVLYKVDYKVVDDEVVIDFPNMVEVEEVYVEKNKKKTEVSEMADMDYSAITVEDLKKHNPSLIDAILKDKATADGVEERMRFATEMDGILKDYGFENPTEVKEYLDSVCEMADEIESLVGDETEEAGEMSACGSKKKSATEQSACGSKKKTTGELSELKGKVKAKKDESDAMSTLVEEMKKITGSKDDKSLTDKLKELVAGEKKAAAESQIKAVKDAFDELSKDVKDEVIKEYLGDDYSKYLKASASEIDDPNWSANAIEDMKGSFPANLEKHSKRLQKLAEKSKVAGEMSAIFNLGNGMNGGENEKTKSVDEMTPDEYATYLGY